MADMFAARVAVFVLVTSGVGVDMSWHTTPAGWILWVKVLVMGGVVGGGLK